MRPCPAMYTDVFEIIDEESAVSSGVYLRFQCQLCGALLSSRNERHV